MSSCKATFGVTFHANMDIEHMAQIWCALVTSEVKSQFPQIDAVMKALNTAITGYKVARKAYETAIKVQKGVAFAITAGSAVTAGQIAPWASAVAGTSAADIALQTILQTLQSAGASVSGKLSCMVTPPQGVTYNSKDIDYTLTEVDKAISEINKVIDYSNCIF